MTSILDSIIETKKKSALAKLARQEYQLARGTAHGKMLKDARILWQSKYDSVVHQMDAIKGDIRQAMTTRQDDLQEALDHYIIETHLHEVPGIGPKLQHMILNEVFISKLSDLRHAYYKSGIGETKQEQINQWIDSYEELSSTMMNQNFPRKQKINNDADKSIAGLDRKINNLEKQRSGLEEKINKIDAAQKVLGHFTPEDFVQARLFPNKWNSKFDNYIRGVFGEWENMPRWFKEIVEEK